MRNLFLLLLVMLFASACTQKDPVNDPVADKWNGYQKFLKSGEQYHTLWAGKNIPVGTVTYGISDDGQFYVTYDCSASGWTISETHMYAGDKKNMPRNKPGSPKVGHFPNSGNHNPRVSTFTYYVPLPSLPACDAPGFAVASHCVVHSLSNQIETAWAEGDSVFTDKDWGWYDLYYFNQPPNKFTILYGTAYNNDTLDLYHIDITNGQTDLIFKEYLGPGRLDAAAYDAGTGMFFFANYTTNTLYANNLKDIEPSFVSGTIAGKAGSATFYDGAYYYVNDETNTLNQVTFGTNWLKASEIIIDTVPGSVTVNDITMNPTGTTLYMIGQVNNGGRELISYDINTETFYSMAITITSGAQLAFGSDGVLYTIAPITEGGSHSLTYMINPSSGTLTPIEDDIIIIDDPFSDISLGPIM